MHVYVHTYIIYVRKELHKDQLIRKSIDNEAPAGNTFIYIYSLSIRGVNVEIEFNRFCSRSEAE